MNHSIGILIRRRVRDEGTDRYKAGVTWPPELFTEIVRCVVVQLALLVQCVTSIWLFARRVQRGSDALYDHRILQLAILGLSVSVMSILHIILRPQYPSGQFWHDCSTKAKWLALLRPMLRPEPGDISETEEILFTSKTRGRLNIRHLIINWVYACIALSIAQVLGLELDKIFTYATMRDVFAAELPNWLLPAFLTPLFVVFVLRKNLFMSPWVTYERIALFIFSVWVIVGVGQPLSQSGSLLGIDVFTKPLRSGLQMWTLLSKPHAYQEQQTVYYIPGPNLTTTDSIGLDDGAIHKNPDPDWSRIWTYGHVPASFPCPQARNDPTADYVWWLA